MSAVNGAAKLDAFQLVMSYDVQVGRELGNKFEITSSNPEKLVSTTRKCSPSEVAYSTGILRAKLDKCKELPYRTSAQKIYPKFAEK